MSMELAASSNFLPWTLPQHGSYLKGIHGDGLLVSTARSPGSAVPCLPTRKKLFGRLYPATGLREGSLCYAW